MFCRGKCVSPAWLDRGGRPAPPAPWRLRPPARTSVSPIFLSALYAPYRGTKFLLDHSPLAGGEPRELGSIVLGKFAREAGAAALRFSKTSSDPNLAAALVEKAADIKDRDASPRDIDRSPRAPD